MKKIVALIIWMAPLSILTQSHASLNHQIMKLNAGIITDKIEETKKFYTEILSFGVTFENDFYLLMHTPNHQAEISFLLPNHPSQHEIFKKPFSGEGMYLTIEVEDVDNLYQEVVAAGGKPIFELRDEPWGDRHFAIQDPNGVGIDLVQYQAPESE